MSLLIALLLGQEDVDALLRDLAGDDPARRSAAVERLAAMPAGAEARIRRGLGAADPEVRGRVAEVLDKRAWTARRARATAALPEDVRRRHSGLIDDLFSASPEKAETAALSLSQPAAPYADLFLTPSEKRKLLAEVVGGVRPGPEFALARSAWVHVLCQTPALTSDGPGAELARRLCLDPDPAVRGFALSNVADALRPEDLAAMAGRWDGLDDQARQVVLNRAVQKRVEPLYPLIREKIDSHAVLHAVLWHRHPTLLPEVLAAIERKPSLGYAAHLQRAGPAAIPALRRMLEADPKDYGATLQALAALGASEAAADVAQLLFLDAREDKAGLLAALGAIGGPSHAPRVAASLRRSLERKEHYPVKEAVDLLLRWKAGEEIVSLIPVLAGLGDFDQTLDVALTVLKPAGASDAILPLLRHPQRGVARKAVSLLAIAGAPEGWTPPLDRLRAELADPDLKYLRPTLTRALGRLRVAALTPDVLGLREDEAVAAFFSELWTREERIAALRSPDPGIRRAALLSLRPADARAAAPALDALAVDPDAAVRAALARSYAGPLRDAPAGPLARLLADASPDVVLEAHRASNRRLGPAEDEALERLLRHPDSWVRFAALERAGLAWMAPRADLAEALEFDEDPQVRETYEYRRFSHYAGPGALERLRAYVRTATGSGDLSTLIFETRALEASTRAGILEILLDRLGSGTPAVEESAAGYWGGKIGTGRVAEMALEDLAKIDPRRAEAAGARLLGSTRADVSVAGARFAAPGKEAVDRLLALVKGAEGDTAAEELGRRGRVPLELLRDPDPALRKRGFLAARIARDPSAFDEVFSAWMSSKDEREDEGVRALAALLDESRAPRLLEALRSPLPRARAQALCFLAEFEWPDASALAADLLDDTYQVSWAAVRYLLDRGDAARAGAMLESAKRHFQGLAAEVVERFGLRDEIPWLMEMLSRPPDDGWRYAQKEGFQALARLGVKEALPGALRFFRSLREYDRAAFLPVLVSLGGQDAVPVLREELEGPVAASWAAAAQALLGLGVTAPRARILAVLELNPLSHLVELASLGRMDLVEDALERAPRTGDELRITAAAARAGLPAARARAVELLDRSPDAMLPILRALWGEAVPTSRWSHVPSPGSQRVEGAIRRVARQKCREALLEPGLPEEVLRRPVPESWWADVDDHSPGEWSYYLDERGRIVVTLQSKVVERWKDRLRRA